MKSLDARTQQNTAPDFLTGRGELGELNGNIMGVMNFAVDVTETVMSRKKIEDSELRFRLLAETLPQLIWEIDGEGDMAYASSRWREYTGIEPEPGTWEKIVHPNDLASVNAAWERSKKR